MGLEEKTLPASGRKLFFGLFIFPLLIAVGMAVLLCSAVLLTHENETPETLLASIKTGSPGKRWQKAFELSNELNRHKPGLRDQGVLKEIALILKDSSQYDAKTRAYMACALSHFKNPEAVSALTSALKDPEEEVRGYALWSLGVLGSKESVSEITPFLGSDSPVLRKMAAYVLGAIGEPSAITDLVPLLKDAVSDVRWNAALALARLGDDSGFSVMVGMLQRDQLAVDYSMTEAQIETAMINALKGIALLQKKESVSLIESISQNDKSLKVREAAFQARRAIHV